MDGIAISDLVAEDLTVEHPHWGKIFVRNKRPKSMSSFSPSRTVILQHGATYGSAAFDLAFDGFSWMDYLAARGFDTYCLDLPGYGRSDRPSIMSEPPEANEPFMRTADAAECLGHVVDFVRSRRAIEQVCLIGWSWGTAITASYTAAHNASVERLVLYAPVWDRSQGGRSPIEVDGKIGAYRTVNRAATLARRQNGLRDEDKGKVMPLAWFDEWWQVTAASDPGSDGDTIRAPNGVVQDGAEYWRVGKPLYDPAALSPPVLVVVGEWDQDTPPYMAQTLFPLITEARWKRMAVLGGGTHSLLMERNRLLLFRSVQQFLEESSPNE